MAKPGSLPGGAGWSFEFKWDGFRALAAFDGVDLRLISRNGNDLSPQFPEIAPLAKALRAPCLLDGELVALDTQSRPSFSLMQQRMDRGTGTSRMSIAYLLFDLPWHDGIDLCPLPLHERRARLESLALEDERWRVPAAHGDGAEMLRLARAHELEGIIAKRDDSPYRPGRRSGEWLKIKIVKRDEFAVGGYAFGKDGKGLGALLLGFHDTAGRLIYAGRVGTGFSLRERRELKARLDAQACAASPFANLKRQKDAVWSTPLLVAEVAYGEWTHDGALRHPSFQGLRSDKSAMDVIDPRRSL
ncbi:MAG: DNA ligase [Planctomycetes bacterium]|nr:DNA ligase [Planctomycetota bacterium]